MNCKNDRPLCKNPDEVTMSMHTKFLALVMVLGVISSGGGVMLLHFFLKVLVSALAYTEMLSVFKPFIITVAHGRLYIF